MNVPPAPILPLLATLVVALTLLPSSVTAETSAPVVQSEAPRDGSRDLHLERLWSAGLDDDVIFGRIIQVVESSHEVYVLDRQLNEVQVLSPEGEWLRAIGTEGEAPGEFRNPSDLFLLGADTVAVVQSMPPKVALLTPDGMTLDDYPLPGAHEGLRMLSRGLERENGLVLGSSGMFMAQGKMETQTSVFAVNRQGEKVAQFFEDRRPVNLNAGEFDEEDMTGIGDVWTLTTEGRVVVAPQRNAYRLHVHDRGGELAFVVERPFEPHVRTAEEREQVAGRYSMNINGSEMEVQVSDVDRVVDGVHAVAGGGFRTLLRERHDGDPPDRFARLDVFDSEGRWIEQLRLHGDVDLDFDWLVFEGGHLYVARNAHDLTGGEKESGRPIDEPMHLVCYDLVD